MQAGEGPEQVAARTGISVETLYQLNGIDPNNYMLYPGDTLELNKNRFGGFFLKERSQGGR